MKKAYVLAIFAVLSWASAPVIFKTLVGGFDFMSAVFFFLAFGGIAMLAYLAMKSSLHLIIIPKSKILLVLGLGIATYLHYLCYTYSLNNINASIVIVIVKLSAIFQVALAAVLLKEKVKNRTWLFFVLGFLGAWIVVNNGVLPKATNLHIAYLTALLAGVMWALFLVLTKKSKMDSFATVGVALLIGAIIMGVHLIATRSLVCPVGMQQWIYLIILGIIPTALGPVAWVMALERAKKVAQIAGFEYFVPVLGVLLSWILLGENISAYLVLGLFIILISIFLNNRSIED